MLGLEGGGSAAVREGLVVLILGMRVRNTGMMFPLD